MTYKLFPAIPLSRGSQLSTRIRVLEKSLGDGYTQVAADGINHIEYTYKAVFEARPNADIDRIVRFLVEHGGVTPFRFDPPDAPAGLRWRCARWAGPTRVSATHQSLTATCIQDFAP